MTTIVDASDDLFADLITPLAVSPVEPVVSRAPAIAPPSPGRQRKTAGRKAEKDEIAPRSVLDVLDAQKEAMANPDVRNTFINFLVLSQLRFGNVNIMAMADYMGATTVLVERNLRPLIKQGGDLVDTCKYTGSVTLNRLMFIQFRDWVLEPYRQEILDAHGARMTAHIFGERFIHPSVQKLIDELGEDGAE